jgi:NADPH2 dehydrogenase
MYPHLFSEISIQGLTLKNRITMAPLYLGYAGQGGTVGEMLLEHYRLMAQSGVAMVVVENATVDHPAGSGSNRTLRADTDDNLDGLKRLAAEPSNRRGALACLQINHAGRFAHATDQPVAPSAVNTFGRMPTGPWRKGDRPHHRQVCRRRGPGQNRRIRHGGTARRHRLPAGPVSLPADQSTHG